jgi:hypothetical protein
MAQKTTVKFNDAFFTQLGTSGPVTAILLRKALRVASQAKATAPVDTGAYKRRIVVRIKRSRYRNVAIIEGLDWKTLLIESKTGNLARAIKAAKGD